jgi:uncharacterized phage-associated protein
MSYDPRAIANIVLDIADYEKAQITNLALNKIIYFLHAWYLAETGRPLVDAKIEAWDYGPVIREVYSEFKSNKSKIIKNRAMKFDVDKLERVIVSEQIKCDDYDSLVENIKKYIHIPASKLVNLSHIKCGPWDIVYNESGRINPGMEITDDIILEYFTGRVAH